MLMGDTWLKTIVRVVTPNAMGTILEVFSYYFVNAMGDGQRRNLYCGSQNNGDYHEDQRAAVLYEIQ